MLSRTPPVNAATNPVVMWMAVHTGLCPFARRGLTIRVSVHHPLPLVHQVMERGFFCANGMTQLVDTDPPPIAKRSADVGRWSSTFVFGDDANGVYERTYRVGLCCPSAGPNRRHNRKLDIPTVRVGSSAIDPIVQERLVKRRMHYTRGVLAEVVGGWNHLLPFDWYQWWGPGKSTRCLPVRLFLDHGPTCTVYEVGLGMPRRPCRVQLTRRNGRRILPRPRIGISGETF